MIQKPHKYLFKNTRHCDNICNHYNTLLATYISQLILYVCDGSVLYYWNLKVFWWGGIFWCMYLHRLSHYTIAVILQHYGRVRCLCDVRRDELWGSCWGVLPAVPLSKPHPEVRQTPGTPGSPGWPLSPGRPTWPLSPILPGRPSNTLPGRPRWPVNTRVMIL